MLAIVEGLQPVELDQTRSRVRERLAAVGISANDASRRAGLGLSYVNDLLSGKSKNPVPHRLAQLATVLDCDAGYLTGEQSTVRAGDAASTAVVDIEASAVMPILSLGQPDADGFFKLPGGKAATMPALFGKSDPDIYAVITPDDANAPRYFAGELVIASPRRPVSRGGFAVIHMIDGRVTIRRVDAILSAVVKATTLEGGETVDIPRDQIESVHKIIAAAEHHH